MKKLGIIGVFKFYLKSAIKEIKSDYRNLFWIPQGFILTWVHNNLDSSVQDYTSTKLKARLQTAKSLNLPCKECFKEGNCIQCNCFSLPKLLSDKPCKPTSNSFINSLNS